MSEEAKKNLEAISEKLVDLPKSVQDLYSAKMEGFVEGWALRAEYEKAHSETVKAEQ